MNSFLRAVADGRPTFGFAQTIPSTLLAEAIGAAGTPSDDGVSGFDWAWLDAQHSPVTLENVLPIVQALELNETQAIIRVGWNDPRLIMRALDIGAIAVVIPMVSTAEEARRAAEATRFPPEGNRSFGPMRGPVVPAEANKSVACLPMVETAEGLENVEAIAATPGVDGIFVGPVDLALSLGVAPAPMPDPLVLDAIDRVVAACEKNGKVAGTLGMSEETATEMLRRGMRFLIVGYDMGLIGQGLARDAANAEKWAREFKR